MRLEKGVRTRESGRKSGRGTGLLDKRGFLRETWLYIVCMSYYIPSLESESRSPILAIPDLPSSRTEEYGAFRLVYVTWFFGF